MTKRCMALDVNGERCTSFATWRGVWKGSEGMHTCDQHKYMIASGIRDAHLFKDAPLAVDKTKGLRDWLNICD